MMSQRSIKMKDQIQKEINEVKELDSLQVEMVSIFDPGTQSWTTHKCHGNLPLRRINHQCWYQAPFFFIYGGQNTTDNHILNDMFALNCESFQWKRFFYYESPPGRLHGGFVNTGYQRSYLVGGISYPENLVLNDVWMLSMEHVDWNTTQNEFQGVTWMQLDLFKNEDLYNLHGHAMIALSDFVLYIFGGYDQNGTALNTSLIMDVDAQTVCRFETKGRVPSPRAYHRLLQIKINQLFLFGGIASPFDSDTIKCPVLLNDVYFLDLDHGFWSQPNIGGAFPVPRHSFAMAVNMSEYHSQVLVLGGQTILPQMRREQILYVFEELDTNTLQEHWGLKKKKKELDFEQQLENEKTNEGFDQSVSRAVLSLCEAEKLIVSQKWDIGEMEQRNKKTKAKETAMIDHLEEIQSKINDTKSALLQRETEFVGKISSKEKQREQHASIVVCLQAIAAQTYKRRKVLQMNAFLLQDAFKKQESLILSLDQFFQKGVKEDLFHEILEDEESVLKDIKQKCDEHKEGLAEFRVKFQQQAEKETIVYNELKEQKQKKLAGSLEAMKRIFVNSVSQDEDLRFFEGKVQAQRQIIMQEKQNAGNSNNNTNTSGKNSSGVQQNQSTRKKQQ